MLFSLTDFLYHLGLAIWIGGVVALGALVAPALFSTLQRPAAGDLFGSILRRFSRLRLVALGVAIAAAAVKFVVWEGGGVPAGFSFSDVRPSDVRPIVQWGALALLSVGIFYEIRVLEPAIRTRVEWIHSEGKDAPADDQFRKLHRRSELIMKGLLLAALAAVWAG